MLPVTLKPNIRIEPLLGRIHLWFHMLSPATASLNLARRYVPTLRSYLASPMLHVAARANPDMRGGPWVDLGGGRLDEVRDLIAEMDTHFSEQLALAEAIGALDRLLRDEARGHALEPLYARIPEPLQGMVELCYDMAHQPGFRLFESRLYKSPLQPRSAQRLTVSEVHGDGGRPFVLTTPRFPDPAGVELTLPCDHPDLDALFAMRREPRGFDEVADALAVADVDRARFRDFFTEQVPHPRPPYRGASPRIRYFGHACLLIETAEYSILIDPLVSLDVPGEPARYSFADLPDRIDTVLITHGHHDHIVPETLLALRHKIGRVVVGRNLDGFPADPSLELALRALGFRDIVEVRDFDEIPLPGGRIVAIPFLGEHHDLFVQSKSGFLIELCGYRIAVMVDACNLSPSLFREIAAEYGEVDVLFLAMECEGAPPSWIYGPLFSETLDRELDRSRLARGCDCEEGLAMVRAFGAREVYIYAMGQEPWLQHILDNPMEDDSLPLREARRLIETCRTEGRTAELLYGSMERVL